MLTGRAATPVPKLVFHDAWEVAGQASDSSDTGATWTNDNPYARLDLEPDRRIDYVFVGWPKAGGAGHVTRCTRRGPRARRRRRPQRPPRRPRRAAVLTSSSSRVASACSRARSVRSRVFADLS